MLQKIWSAVHHAEQLDHALYAVKFAQRPLHDRKQVESREAGILIGLLDRDLLSHLADGVGRRIACGL